MLSNSKFAPHLLNIYLMLSVDMKPAAKEIFIAVYTACGLCNGSNANLI